MLKRVLMIDDAVPMHRIVGSLLNADEFELHSATDGAAGVDAARRLRPAVILLDVDLPDMDGFAVCRLLKAQPETADVPVMFLTAEGGEMPRQTGMELGAAAFISKPVRTDTLPARINACILGRLHEDQVRGTDGLTGLWTRERLEAQLGERLAAGSRRPTAYVIADVNGLRLLNSRYGSVVGDAVLRAIGGLVRDHAAAANGSCGGGGGQFAVALPDVNRAAARRFAERLATAVASVAVLPDGMSVACCFGVADTDVARGGGGLVGAARGMVARAKQNGPGSIAVARMSRPKAAAPAVARPSTAAA